VKLLRETTLYLLGTGLGRGLPFLLIPVLTAELSVADYGKLSLATTVAGFLAIVIGMNPNLYVFAHFFKYPRSVLAVRLFNILLLALLSCVPVLLVYPLIANRLDGYHITTGIFLVLVAIALGRAVAAMHLAVDQMERKPLSYFVFYALMSASVVGVLFVLITTDHFGWQALLFAEAGVLILLNIASLMRLAQRGFLTVTPNRQAAREFALFSVPLLGHAAALWVISFVDRIIIADIAGIEAVGAYSVAHTVALGLSLGHESIHRAWQPVFFKKMQTGNLDEHHRIIRYTWIYYGGVVLTALLYLLVIQILLRLFLPPAYHEVFTFLPYLVAGFALLGMYRFSAGYLYHYGNTRILSVVTIGCGVLHVAATVALVSIFGAVGAAVAATFSYFVLWAVVTVLVSRIYNVPWMSREIWR
jgi:O-antigen/teichoic acid export membrane protein